MDLFDIAVAKKLAGGGGGGGATIEALSVTENGTYTAPSGVDGYSPVTVNVSGSGGGINVGDVTFTRESSTQLSARLNGEPKAFAIYFIGDFTQSSSSTSIYFGTMVVAKNSTKVIKVYNRANGKYGELSSIASASSAHVSWTYANNIITVTTDSLYFPSDTFGFYKITYIY